MALDLVDLRTYAIAPRMMPEFVEVFERMALPVLRETLGHPLGFYTSVTGALNQFVHLWAYESMAEYERRAGVRDRDPRFREYLAASKALIVSQENRLIRTAVRMD